MQIKNKKGIRYYINSEEMNFFENNNFSKEKLPKWKDISFILKNDKLAKELEISKYQINVESTIPMELWEKIENYVIFDENASKLETLREAAFINSKEFKELLKTGKVKKLEDIKFSEELSYINMLKRFNIQGFSSMYEYLCAGYNIGNCLQTSELFSLMHGDNVEINKGRATLLKGTLGSSDGSHVWLENNDYVIDTSLLVAFNKIYKEQLGYETTKKYTKRNLIEEFTKGVNDMHEIFGVNYLLFEKNKKEGRYSKNSNGRYPELQPKPSYRKYSKELEKLNTRIKKEESENGAR